MRKRIGCIGVSVITLMSLTGAISQRASGALAPAASQSSSPQWVTLSTQAQEAIEASSGAQVEMQSPLNEPSSSLIQTVAGGLVEAEELSYSASIDGEKSLVELTLLGGQQLLVNYWTFGASVIQVLALVPSTSRISFSGQLAESNAPSPNVSNCYALTYIPAVVSTIYGPLIEGVGGAACTYAPEVLGAIVALYSGGSGVGSSSGGSSSPNEVYSYIAPYDYYPCHAAGTTSPFSTAVIFSVNGTVAGGGSSGNAWLYCQP